MGTSGQMSTSNQYVKYTITINQNWQDIGGNYSNVTVSVRFFRTNVGYETYGSGTVYCKINGTTYSASVSPSQRITNAGIVLFSQTLNIGHNSDGSKYLDTYAWISLNTPLSSSEQWYGEWLSTIPRASSVSGGSGNIGGTSNINISRASSNFDHILYYSFGSISWRWIASNVGTSYTWTLPSDLYGQIPNANSGTGTLICETYSGSSYIGTSYVNFTANVVNSNPVFSASQLTYKDINSTVTAITQNNQWIVQNQSELQAVFTAATAQNSAILSKYQITFNGGTQEKTAASTINYGFVDSSQNLTLQVKAIDSRGNSTTITKAVTILAYSPPIINASAARINNFENETILKADVQVSSVNNLNSLQTLKYQLQKIPDGQWSNPTDFPNSTPTQLVLDNLFAWNLEVLATDKFGATAYGIIVPKGLPIAFFDTKKLSVGINCLPEKSNSLEINGKNIYDMIYPVGSIYMSVSSVNPTALFGGTWVRWGNGKTIVGVDENDPNGYFPTPEWVGGARTHRHAFRIGMHWWYGAAAGEGNGNSTGAYRYSDGQYDGWARTLASLSTTLNTGFTTSSTTGTPSGKWSLGDTDVANNWAPCITCYLFKRTA
jgi:hypothetical protein